MTTRENRLLPMGAIAAMLVVSSTIIGLAWWVGDAIGPGFAAMVQVSARDTATRQQVVPVQRPAPADRAKSAPAAAAKQVEANVRR